MSNQKFENPASGKSNPDSQTRIAELEAENEYLKAQLNALQLELAESNRRLGNIEERNRHLEQALKERQTQKPIKADSDYDPHKW